MKARCYVIISGRVQGVFFRQNTLKWAKSLELRGWVRNTEDGNVEALFEGEKENIEKILKLIKKGPPLSKVEKVKINWENFQGEFKEFEIKYD